MALSDINPELSSTPPDTDRWFQFRDDVDRALDLYTPVRSDDDTDDDTAEILRVFVQELPKAGQLALMAEILFLKTNDKKLRQLRNFLVDSLLGPVRAAGRKNPNVPITLSTYPEAAIVASSGNEQQKLKKECLRRDGRRCPITGFWDREYATSTPRPVLPVGAKSEGTECAHILPFALRKFDSDNSQDVENKAAVWWALYRYFPALQGQIDAGTINQHGNVLTMSINFHHEFDNYNVTLRPTGTHPRIVL
ncbi:hypothetical protein AAE478_006787 [Parahypoxylon ruwenzoriense]